MMMFLAYNFNLDKALGVRYFIHFIRSGTKGGDTAGTACLL